MKAKIIKKALFIIYIGLSFSCKKNTEEKEVSFPHSLYPESISKKTDVRLFSNQKEITDPEVKRRFVNNLEIFNIQNSSFQDIEKMTFLSRDTAKFSADSKFSIVKNGDSFLFYSNQYMFSHENSYHLKIAKNRADKIPVPFVNDISYLEQEVRVAKGNYRELKFPLLSFKAKFENNNGMLSQLGIIFNELNEAVISKLGIKDTLAVQEFQLILKLKN